jgi:hypothetical protein
MKYRYDRELGIVDEEGLQVLQLSANYCTEDFKDHAGSLLARELNKLDDIAIESIADLDRAMRSEKAAEDMKRLMLSCKKCRELRKHIAVDWGKAFCKTCRQMRDNPKARQHNKGKESKP